MNIFKRMGWKHIGDAIGAQRIERENAITILNTAQPDWEAIADQMYFGICRALSEPSEKDRQRLLDIASMYEIAKRVKP